MDSGSKLNNLPEDEPTVYIPFKGKRRSVQRMSKEYRNSWGRFNHGMRNELRSQLNTTGKELDAFIRQDQPPRDSGFGVGEVPTAIVVGRDRALVSRYLYMTREGYFTIRVALIGRKNREAERPDPLHVQLDEADCMNATTALRAIISGFMSQFDASEVEGADPESSFKKKASTTLAPYDMAKLVTSYLDHYKSKSHPPNLVITIEQLEPFDTDVINSVIYACSKHLDSLPFVFIMSMSESTYLQRAFTTATRTMLDTVVFQPPSGPALCEFVLFRGMWCTKFSPALPILLQLGEPTIKLIKDVIEKTDGRIDALFTALQLIHMEHYQYYAPIIAAGPEYRPKDKNQELQDASTLLAFMALSERKGSLADGFSPSDVAVEIASRKPESWRLKPIPRSDGLSLETRMLSILILYHLVRLFYELGSYRQEIPLSLLDLLELSTKGDEDLVKYMNWMVSKGLESTSVKNLRYLGRTVVDLSNEPSLPSIYGRSLSYLLKRLESISDELDLNKSAKTSWANDFIRAFSNEFYTYRRAYDELYIANSSNGVKEILDPAPRSTILSALIRPGAYLRCDCCDPEEAHTPENMAGMPDTCALYQRSLEAGRLLNIADWFGAFTSIMQNEKVQRASQESGATRVRRSASHTRRGASSVHMESDADAEGEVDETLEVQREHQARFLQSMHELEFVGLSHATGRRKEHVLRTVFETGD